MTDSEKLLAIVDRCKARRQQAIDGWHRHRDEMVAKGKGLEATPGFFQLSFDIYGNVLKLAGHSDELDWTRDGLGVV